MEGAHGVTERKTRVVRQPGIALTQEVKVICAVLLRIAQVRDEVPHQVVPQLALARFGGIVESQIPRLSRQLAGARGEPRLPDQGAHEKRKLRRGLGSQRIDVLDAEAPVATWGAGGSNTASVGPLPESRRRHVQGVRRLMEAGAG